MNNQEDFETTDKEISMMKRKHSGNNNHNKSIGQQDLEEFQIPNKRRDADVDEDEDEDEDEFSLALSLSFGRPPRSKKKTTLNTTKPQLSWSLPPLVTSLSVTRQPQHHIPRIEIPSDGQMTPKASCPTSAFY
ncbi:hypothetical protein OIU84_009257 [Salix udensis]|uniref:Uncharacterized protein n=1 Tax=Salix udensis TaxID=889485 RepID=A0AAD6JR79_9ROSI|nr:hypothetical protein OIU84_009257 [Salix udensis]